MCEVRHLLSRLLQFDSPPVAAETHVSHCGRPLAGVLIDEAPHAPVAPAGGGRLGKTRGSRLWGPSKRRLFILAFCFCESETKEKGESDLTLFHFLKNTRCLASNAGSAAETAAPDRAEGAATARRIGGKKNMSPPPCLVLFGYATCARAGGSLDIRHNLLQLLLKLRLLQLPLHELSVLLAKH